MVLRMNVSRWSGRDGRIGKEVAQYALQRRDDAATDSGDPQQQREKPRQETRPPQKRQAA